MFVENILLKIFSVRSNEGEKNEVYFIFFVVFCIFMKLLNICSFN